MAASAALHICKPGAGPLPAKVEACVCEVQVPRASPSCSPTAVQSARENVAELGGQHQVLGLGRGVPGVVRMGPRGREMVGAGGGGDGV